MQSNPLFRAQEIFGLDGAEPEFYGSEIGAQTLSDPTNTEYNGYVAAYQAAKQRAEKEVQKIESNFSNTSLYSLYEKQLSILGI